ncbi:MAG: flagellar biosynthesis protein FlgN [Marinibacterium sp.]
MDESHQTRIEKLDRLLDAERRALIAGDYDRLTQLHDRKEVLLSDLQTGGSRELADLSQIREKIHRNQVLMNSALEGIRAVADRMAELRRVRQKLATYDDRGNRREYTTTQERKLERRA